MNPALTVKSQVTLPKAIRDFLGLSPGQRVSFEPLPDGRVAISAADSGAPRAADPIAALRGSATVKRKTDDVMRMTRGDDWNQP
jgi:AbrB family looped-hinge helix DNA binding protein